MRKILCLLSVLLSTSLFYPYFETFIPNNPVTAEEEQVYTETGTVIIDPGHGGADGGATGAKGLTEKYLNLSIALKLKDIFTLAGYGVIMTRDTDDDTDGKEGFFKKEDILARKELAELYPEAIFLSIHTNASTSTNDKGFQVFYGSRNEKSIALAEEIYSAMSLSGLATRMREVKKAPESVYLMQNLSNPCVLIECGFIGNREDVALLTDRIYRQKLATVIFSATVNFLEKPTSPH